MKTMTPRRHLLFEIAGRILALPADAPLRIAIDGVDGAGKTHFADELARALQERQPDRSVIRASVDGFHRPRSERYRLGRASPEGFFLDSYDYASVIENLLGPLGPRGNRRYRTAVFDHFTDSEIDSESNTAPSDAILLVDGIFLHREELRDHWNFSILLDVPFEISIPRGAARGPGFGSPDPHAETNRRYVEGQRLYLKAANPHAYASLIIDNSDLEAPAILTNDRAPLSGDEAIPR